MACVSLQNGLSVRQTKSVRLANLPSPRTSSCPARLFVKFFAAAAPFAESASK
jgi:hypothetical protein